MPNAQPLALHPGYAAGCHGEKGIDNVILEYSDLIDVQEATIGRC